MLRENISYLFYKININFIELQVETVILSKIPCIQK